MNLQNKTAIITGAAAGIGAASAALFAREGARVVAVDIDSELLDQITAQIGRSGGECLAVVADVSQGGHVENVLRSTLQKFGRVDILFNNAGIVPTGKLEAISEEQWDRAMAINVKSMYLFCHAVALPVYRLHFRREISLMREAFTARIAETVTNLSGAAVEFQWVQHAAFGEPFFANGEATLFVSGRRGVTWPAGYEGHELLARDVEFQWPYAQSIDGKPINLSQPFVCDGTGFVAGVLAGSDRENAFVTVHNRRHQLVAGYCFNPKLFPWIVLWEENRARGYSPWNKRTRVRGVEFGTSPMPLGLTHAREIRRLFDTPVLRSIPAKSCLQAQYDLFLHPVPPQWTQIKDVHRTEDNLVVRGDSDEEIKLQRGKRRR